MKRKIFNLRNVATMLACLAATVIFASCEKPNDDDGSGNADVEFTVMVGYSDEWTPFAGKTGVTFTNSDNSVLEIDDNGTTVEFTGKAVGNSTVTAALGSETRKALMRVRAAEGGRKYITYNKPVKAFFIEYNGGAIAANQNTRAGKYGYVIEAYENKKWARVSWYENLFECHITYPNGDWCFNWECAYGGNVWMLDKLNGNENWESDAYLDYEYPLDRFAFCVSKRTLGGGFLWTNPGGLGDLGDIARHPNSATMPDNTDVTQYYLRSEKVCNIMCDVYKISTATFWVDPATGFTLKLESRDDEGNLEEYESYEVTRLVVGTPDWDGEHLHPLPTDTVLEP